MTSKEFTEQIVLGQIMGMVFEAAGATVIDKTSIQGSIGAREAVKSGTADATYEYTGTGWITYLGHAKPIVDPQEQWKAVRDEDLKNGIVWLPPSKLNNTYALALNAANQKKLGVRDLSDVARAVQEGPRRGDAVRGERVRRPQRRPAGHGAGVRHERAVRPTSAR